MKCQWMVLLFSATVACVMSCEVPCTRNLVPVCGTDGENFVVFSNECVMNNQKCKDGKSWTKSDLRSCGVDNRSVEVPSCPLVCPAIYEPTCGSDGKEYKLFGNKCSMGVSNCLRSESYQVVSLELCPKES